MAEPHDTNGGSGAGEHNPVPPVPARTTDLETALRTTGAVREFRADPVSDATLARIVEVARFAPSGANRQPWRVVVVRDPTRRDELGRWITLGAREYLALGNAGQRPFGLTDRGRWPGPGEVDLEAARQQPAAWPAVDQIVNAPALLAIAVELGALAATDAALDRHGIVGGASVYPFCRDLLLAGRLEGLGGVLTTFAVRYEPEVASLLRFDPGWALAGVIAMGYPVRQPRRLTRRPVAELARIDTFDGPALDPDPAAR